MGEVYRQKGSKNRMKAIFIRKTNLGRGIKDRWECPNCRSTKKPECRFNLSPKKRGLTHVCRFCKKDLKLER